MSEPKTPLPVKLVASLIFRAGPKQEDSPQFAAALTALEDEFGPADFHGPLMVFNHTDYYNEEMGASLLRRFVSFKKLVGRDRLAEIKLFTNSLEKKFLDQQGRRTINIDPGLLSPENLVLASGKNFTHRIYLQQGIFAEVTLLFQNKKFIGLPWTYPDYASAEMTAVLTKIRNLLLTDLRGLAAS